MRNLYVVQGWTYCYIYIYQSNKLCLSKCAILKRNNTQLKTKEKCVMLR